MTDLRIKKTDAIISTSFVDLVLEKGFDNVTVKDIASRSMINRKTFYAHYEDKFALTDKIGQDILNWFTKALQKRASLLNQGVTLINAISKIEQELRQLLIHWNRPIKAIMTIPEARIQLIDGLKKILEMQLQAVLAHPGSELEVNAIGGIMLGMIKYYLQTNSLPSQEELKQLSNSLVLIFGES